MTATTGPTGPAERIDHISIDQIIIDHMTGESVTP